MYRLFPLALSAVGIALVSAGLLTRRRPGLVAGFDAARCSDPAGLARWVGNGGVALGGLCLAGALAVALLPDWRGVTSAMLGVAAVTGAGIIAAGCGRFVRR